MKFLHYLAAFVMLAGAALANSAYPSTNPRTLAGLAALTQAQSDSGTYKHVYIAPTAFYDYDSTSTLPCPHDYVVEPSYVCPSDADGTGRWVRGPSTNSGISNIATMSALQGLTASQMAAASTIILKENNTGYGGGGANFIWEPSWVQAPFPNQIVAPSDHPGVCTSGCMVKQPLAAAFNNFDYLPLQPASLTFGTRQQPTYINGPIYAGAKTNIWWYTEAFGNVFYGESLSTKYPSATVTWNGITLARWASTNFYGSVSTNTSAAGYVGLTPGVHYLMSYYAVDLDGGDHFIWMRPLATSASNGHGPHLVDGTVRRIWAEVVATSSSLIDGFADPTVPLGSGSAANPYWVVSGYPATTAGDSTVNLNMYMGGFSIEPLSTTGKVGIAMIGDSTWAGSSGKIDAIDSREISTYAAALMNVPWFNRAVGGQTCAQMLARWAADMTPLAVNSKYVLIVCGINDAGQGRSAAAIEADIAAMDADAVADGMIPVHGTIAPNFAVGNNSAYEAVRLTVNAWIKQTYPRVLDFASLVQDPNATSLISQNPAYIGDETHPAQPMRRLEGLYVANSFVGNNQGYPQIWDFPWPSPYQPVAATTWTSPGSFVGTLTGHATLDAALTGAAFTGLVSVSNPGGLGVTVTDTGSYAKVSLVSLAPGYGAPSVSGTQSAGDKLLLTNTANVKVALGWDGLAAWLQVGDISASLPAFNIYTSYDTTSAMTRVASFLGDGTLNFYVASAGPVLKQGANGRVGTFVCNGASTVTISNTLIAVNDNIIISLNAVGGTVGAVPTIKTITGGTGFTIACTALDTSTYNYAVIKNAS